LNPAQIWFRNIQNFLFESDFLESENCENDYIFPFSTHLNLASVPWKPICYSGLSFHFSAQFIFQRAWPTWLSQPILGPVWPTSPSSPRGLASPLPPFGPTEAQLLFSFFRQKDKPPSPPAHLPRRSTHSPPVEK
jgi:hypothetical protein